MKTAFRLMTAALLLASFGWPVLAQAQTPPTTLKIVIPGDRPADMDKVIAEAEKRLARTLNVKLNVVFVPWADLGSKTQISLASGEPNDLIFDAPWLHLSQMISAGYYADLEPLLAKGGKNVLKAVPKQLIDANRYDGKIMGLPLANAYKQGTTYYVRKDLRTKHGVAPIKTYEDLVKFAYLIKAKEPTLIPMLNISGSTNYNLVVFRAGYDFNLRFSYTPAAAGALYFKGNDGKVYNQFDSQEPKFWSWVQESRKFYQDKIFDPDLFTIRDTNAALQSGKYAIGIANDFGVASGVQAALAKNVPGAEFEAVTFWTIKPKAVISDFKAWNFLCLANVSKNKDKAVAFLDWVMSSQDNYDLLAYGIKGTNWESVGKDQYRSIGNGYGYFPYAWIWNPTQDRINADFDPQALDLVRFLKVADNFEYSLLAGFNFDPEAVTNELAQLAVVDAKYGPMILNGIVDPDSYWDKYKAEASALTKKVQIELQKQISAFLAAKAKK